MSRYPSQRLSQNLGTLAVTRQTYFTNKGLPVYVQSTLLKFIKEENRIPLAKLALPFFFDDNNRRILSSAIEQQHQWEPPEPSQSPWTFLRQMGPVYSQGKQPIDDLMQLEYPRLLEGVEIPKKAELSLFWAGLSSFLENSLSILEEFTLLAQRERELQARPPEMTLDPRVVRLLDFREFQAEHHLFNLIFRIRAGWDKLIDYLLVPYYGIKNMARRWEPRVAKLNRELPQLLIGGQPFGSNLSENASQIADLKDLRDGELHKIGQRAKETFGDKLRAPSLAERERIVLDEHYRLQDAFLLFVALVRSGARESTSAGTIGSTKAK